MQEVDFGVGLFRLRLCPFKQGHLNAKRWKNWSNLGSCLYRLGSKWLHCDERVERARASPQVSLHEQMCPRLGRWQRSETESKESLPKWWLQLERSRSQQLAMPFPQDATLWGSLCFGLQPDCAEGKSHFQHEQWAQICANKVLQCWWCA